MAVEKEKGKKLLDRLTYTYIRRIKKWMFCPACQTGKLSINKDSTVWTCKNCGYNLSTSEFEDDYVFWFCDECNAYLNNQEGFVRHSPKHICRNCGYENDTTFNNIKGLCSDCGKILPNAEATLCIDCKQIRKEKAKQWLLKAGIAVGAAAALAGAAYAVAKTSSKETKNLPILPLGSKDDGDIVKKFNFVTEQWLKTVSEDELYAVESEMFSVINSLDFESREYLELDLVRIDIVNTIASRFPLNLPAREHGWYLPNDD